ncbi:MAG: NADPH-dependent FMN reductase [Gemmatimonadota bacterium]
MTDGVSASLRLLGLTGSLRARSINTELLRAASVLLPPGAHLTMYDGLGALPHFNPDLDVEGATPPETVAALRAAVREADALLVSSPEYAHGVAGSFKNLLDWLVSGPEMLGKPVCILSASSSATFAPAALVETLRTMSGTVVSGAAITVPVNGRRLDAAAIAAEPDLAAVLRHALALVAGSVSAPQT